jgi:LytR cell envelope-related transcriptional attenuator
MELLKEVGAVAGLASFVGLALLCLLYFAQARDVRRLRETASFLVERGSDEGEPVAPAERAAAAVAAKEPEEAAAAAAATAPTEAEAFRRAELARQAAERRQRFEQRRSGNGRERPAWLSEPLSIAVVAVGAILLLAGIGFGVTRVVGGDDESSPENGAATKGPCPPGQTRVAVLNGTATAGLAAQFAAPLKQAQYKTGPIGNTESPVATSVVMFDPQIGADCGPVISRIVGIQKQQPMSPEVQGLAEGDPVAVVLGDDQAGGSSGDTTGSGI